MMEDKISELEDRAIELTQSEQQFPQGKLGGCYQRLGAGWAESPDVTNDWRAGPCVSFLGLPELGDFNNKNLSSHSS